MARKGKEPVWTEWDFEVAYHMLESTLNQAIIHVYRLREVLSEGPWHSRRVGDEIYQVQGSWGQFSKTWYAMTRARAEAILLTEKAGGLTHEPPPEPAGQTVKEPPGQPPAKPASKTVKAKA